jgi:hypothetical protein
LANVKDKRKSPAHMILHSANKPRRRTFSASSAGWTMSLTFLPGSFAERVFLNKRFLRLEGAPTNAWNRQRAGRSDRSHAFPGEDGLCSAPVGTDQQPGTGRTW